jgi:hypothetical protein
MMTSLANSLLSFTTHQKNEESNWLVIIYNTSTQEDMMMSVVNLLSSFITQQKK